MTSRLRESFSPAILLLLVCWLLVLQSLAPASPEDEVVPYPDPSRFETEIRSFEAESKSTPLPAGAIIAVGSSSMRMWATIQEDLFPLEIIQRGFGGSMMNDVLHFAERIILPHRPRAILLYEGDNDAAIGITAERIVAVFRALVAKVHGTLPATRIYVISIKPSPARMNVWDEMMKANKLLKDACETNPLLTFIDVATPMLDENGLPRSELFRDDLLHLNERGYALWKGTIRPILMEKEARHEK